MGAADHGIAGRSLLRRLRSGQPLSGDEERLLLPRPPGHLEFNQLGFDNRTSNALDRAGFRDCPAELGDLTLGEILNLRGFGRRCLEVYLQASLAWNQSGQDPRPVRSVSDRLSSLINNAKAGRLSVLAPCLVPALPPGVAVADLHVSVRTLNCLQRLGIGMSSQKLGDFTIGQLLDSKAFGRLSLVNLLEAIRRVYACHPTDSAALASASRSAAAPLDIALALADRLEEALAGDSIREKDRRMGLLLRQLRCRNSTDLTESLRGARIRSDQRLQTTAQIVDLVERASHLSLEQEALAVRGIEPGTRYDGMLRAYFGFGGRVSATLQQVADEYGLSRERVRQICSPTLLRKTPHYQPVLNRVLQRLRDAAPGCCKEIEVDLVRGGGVEPETEVGEILRYGQAAGIESGLVEIVVQEERLVVYQRNKREIQNVRFRAKRLMSRHGATTARRVHDDAIRPERQTLSLAMVEQILQLDPQLCGMLRDPVWLMFANSAGESFSRKVHSVLAIAGSLTVRELRNALRREYRDGSFVPPSAVLAKVLPTVPGVSCSADIVELAVPLDHNDLIRSSDVIAIVQILRDHKRICERRQLQELARAAGVSEPNFWRIVNYSPLIARPARGVYSLVGTKPSPGVVEDLRASNKLARGGGIDRGWTNDGRLWLAYRLSASTLETGIVAIPAAVRGSLSDEYTIVSGDVATGGGPIRIGGTSAWGFRYEIADAGAEVGDCMVLVFDLSARSMEVHVGDETIVDQWLPDEA